MPRQCPLHVSRPKGTGYRQQIFDNLVLPRIEELINVAIKKALAGNDTMLRLFLERILPPKPHGEPINIELPMDITNKELLLTMGEKVLLYPSYLKMRWV